jgi:hypothetical protein
MKRLILCGTLTMLLLIGAKDQMAQDKKYPEPELFNKMYYYDQTANKEVEMEYGVMSEEERSKGFAGMGGEEMLLQFSKEKSMVRIKKSEKVSFIIKVNGENDDLTSMFSVIQLTSNPKTKKREIITGKTDAWTSNTNTKLKKIPFSVKKAFTKKDEYDNVYFVIRTATLSNLEPGEYAFIEMSTNECSFFGID